MRFLKRLRQYTARRHLPELPLIGEFIRLPDLRQHADRFFPHGTGVARIYTQAGLFVGVGATGADFHPAIGELIDHDYAFGYTNGAMVGQNRHTETDPDALSALAECPKYDLWARRAREPGQEVVLDEPEIVEADSIG